MKSLWLMGCAVALFSTLFLMTPLVRAQAAPPPDPNACSGIRQTLEQPDLDQGLRERLELMHATCRALADYTGPEGSHAHRTLRVPSEVEIAAVTTSWQVTNLSHCGGSINLEIDRTDGGPRNFQEAWSFPGARTFSDTGPNATTTTISIDYPDHSIEAWTQHSIKCFGGLERSGSASWIYRKPKTGDYNVFVRYTGSGDASRDALFGLYPPNAYPFSPSHFHPLDGSRFLELLPGARHGFGPFRLERDGLLKLEISPRTTTVKPSVQRPAPPCGGPPESLQTKTMTLSCVRTDTGAVVPFCDVELKWNARFGTGGHEHHTNRPPGKIADAAGATGGSVGPGGPAGSLRVNTGGGSTTVTYTAPEAAGDIEITGLATATVDGQRISSSPATASIEVTEANLIRASGAGLQIETASTMHDNHDGYATQATIDGLRILAVEFSSALVDQGVASDQVPPIRVAELSLPRGGLMDFDVEWTPPHCGHRRGDQVDVGMSTFSKKHKTALERALGKSPFTTPVPAESPANPTANHWHLKLK